MPPGAEFGIMKQSGKRWLGLCAVAGAFAFPSANGEAAAGAPSLENPPDKKPETIVLVLSDDVGRMDLGCYGAEKIETPNLDRLAAEGIRLLNAHSPSSVCSPTRYSILTGRYCWRSRLTHHVLAYDEPLLIDPQRQTLPGFFQTCGYATACIGKWHLGFGLKKPVDLNSELDPGPLEVGFDYFFGGNGNKTPCVWIENHRVVGLEPDDPLSIRETKSGGWRVQGGQAARALRTSENNMDRMVRSACEWLERRKGERRFLYFAPNNVHAPHSPSSRFKGASGCGPYGDYMVELDDAVGQLRHCLEAEGSWDTTLFIFTSDNGALLDREAVEKGHLSNGRLLGQKYDIWEGGSRIPLIATFPGVIPRHTTSDALFGLTDFFASFAAMLGEKLDPQAAPDSFDLWNVLSGQGGRGRACFVVRSGWNSNALYRDGWVYIDRAGDGWVQPNRRLSPFEIGFENSDYDAAGKLCPSAKKAGGQLYDLKKDPAQTTDLIARCPERASRMAGELRRLMAQPATRPGCRGNPGGQKGAR